MNFEELFPTAKADEQQLIDYVRKKLEVLFLQNEAAFFQLMYGLDVAEENFAAGWTMQQVAQVVVARQKQRIKSKTKRRTQTRFSCPLTFT